MNKMIRFLISILGLATALYATSLPLLSPIDAQAGTEQTELEKKAELQERYRYLLQDAARLQFNAEKSRRNYNRAVQSRYPRGSARQQYIIDAETAEKELVKVNEEIAGFLVDAGNGDFPASWLYEVDDEPITVAPPASASEDDDDRGGRNPLYLKDPEDS